MAGKFKLREGAFLGAKCFSHADLIYPGSNLMKFCVVQVRQTNNTF